jgi:hypothetical protein
LIRPDGVVWGAGLILLSFSDIADHATRKKEIRKLTLHLVVPGLIYFIWRAWYFSEWLPLPFLVKAAGERDLVLVWSRSLDALAVVLVPALIAAIFVKPRRTFLIQLLMLFVLPCMFYSSIKLEQNIGNRFLAPMFFGLILLFIHLGKLKGLAIFIIISSALGITTLLPTVSDLLDSKDGTTFYIANELQGMQGRMLVTEAGKLAYYSNWLTEDSWGLNTPRYAHTLIGSEDVAGGDYDLIVMHCTIALLKTEIPESPSQSRSWENQCAAMISYVKAANYRVVLVPYLKTHPSRKTLRSLLGMRSNSRGYSRYDMYAISPTYKNAGALYNVLRRHGGINYAPELVQ